jgi:hypothetical protein
MSVNMLGVLTEGRIAFVSRVDQLMSDPVFQQAFETVRKSWSDEAWITLTPRQITEAIYREIRRIDAEAVREVAVAPGYVKAAKHSG